ncbi:MAG: hypothetical protein PHY54_17585 [Methylococcales bacterium]|nr:hypothetical protein [Methylococcales bacterium]
MAAYRLELHDAPGSCHFHPQPGREQQQAAVSSGKGNKPIHKNAEPQYHHANQLDFIDL